MPRPKRLYDFMMTRFPEQTFDRVDAVLDRQETRTDFIRNAVERELRRRERAAPPARVRAVRGGGKAA